MGRKLDALLGRNFKTSKFKTLAKLAISRIAILKNQRQVRYSFARSDVIELLKLGHQERALLRVDHVMKEQKMLDVFVMIENYCYLLIERVALVQKNRECPDELKEAISSLIFASSRCGEFPELLKIREILTATFGKDFAARAVELLSNCGVNLKMIQKLSSRQLSLESRLKFLKEIASADGIILHSEEEATVVAEEKLDVDQKQKQPETYESCDLDNLELREDTHYFPEQLNMDEKLSESIKARKYRDAAAAAQEAFETAAYAAVAARAAVELSRSESQDNDPDDQSGSNHQQGTVYESDGSSTPELPSDECEASDGIKLSDNILEFDKIHPINNFSTESEGEDMAENNNFIDIKEMEDRKQKGIERIPSASSSDSDGDTLSEKELSSNMPYQNEQLDNEIVVNRVHDLDSDWKPRLPTNENQQTRQYDAASEENLSEVDENELPYGSLKWIPLRSKADSMIKPMEGKSRLTSTNSLNFVELSHPEHSTIDRKWISMRTRRVHKV